MISILLVDEIPDNPLSIRRLLSSSSNNFELTCANAYHEIVAGFHSKTSDVCLIDSDMDTGLKLLAQARSVGYLAPIVLVVPNIAREMLKAVRHGVADCLIRDDLSAAGIEYSLCCVVEQARNSSLQIQREQRYLALLDNANEIVYTHDLEGNFTSMNRIGEQLLGYSESEILRMNMAQVVAPEDRFLVQKLIARTLDAQSQSSDQVALITRWGGRLTVEISAHPINHDGQTREIQGIVNATSELQGSRCEAELFIEKNQPNPDWKDKSTGRQHTSAKGLPPLKESPFGRSILTL
jgi:two-component system response regulator